LHGDNLAVKLALEKLVDINQKQLDGQYNIPEGATFWVPLTAAYYRNKGTDAAGSLDTSQLDASAGNLDGSAAALTQAAYALTTSARDEFNMARLEVGNRNADSGVGTRKEDSLYYQSEKFGLAPTPYDPVKDPNSLYSRSEKGDTPAVAPSSLDTMLQRISELFRGFTGGTMLGGQNLQNPQSLKSASGIGQANANPAPVSKLDLKISSSTVLNLDGRILANAMKNYLAQDLLRTDATQGTVTKSYVI
jgi:hypothetical protein